MSAPLFDVKDYPLPDSDEPEQYDLVEAMEHDSKLIPPDGLWLDLGCGKERQDGFIGMDLYPQDDKTMKVDLFFAYEEGEDGWNGWRIDDTKGLLPAEAGFLADNTVSYVYSAHFIEHIPQCEWDSFWKELYRICKPGARLILIFPYGTSAGAFQDPTHRQVITIERFSYLNRQWREATVPTECYADVNFRHYRAPWWVWDNDFIGCNEKAKEYHLKHTFNAVHEAVVFLECVK